jgi:hypothetical protein
MSKKQNSPFNATAWKLDKVIDYLGEDEGRTLIHPAFDINDLNGDPKQARFNPSSTNILLGALAESRAEAIVEPKFGNLAAYEFNDGVTRWFMAPPRILETAKVIYEQRQATATTFFDQRLGDGRTAVALLRRLGVTIISMPLDDPHDMDAEEEFQDHIRVAWHIVGKFYFGKEVLKIENLKPWSYGLPRHKQLMASRMVQIEERYLMQTLSAKRAVEKIAERDFLKSLPHSFFQVDWVGGVEE